MGNPSHQPPRGCGEDRVLAQQLLWAQGPETAKDNPQPAPDSGKPEDCLATAKVNSQNPETGGIGRGAEDEKELESVDNALWMRNCQLSVAKPLPPHSSHNAKHRSPVVQVCP